MRLRVLGVLVIGAMIAWVALSARAEDKKKAKIVGTWTVVSMEHDGQKAPEEETKKIKLVITGDKITVQGGDKTHEATYKLDASKKPATIDITPSDGPDKDKVVPGIYSLDGDNLKMCFGKAGSDRPKEFSTKAGSPGFYVVLKREKS